MSQLKATCVRAAELGPAFDQKDRWLSALAQPSPGNSTIVVEPPTDVHVNSLPLFQAKIEAEYPDIFGWFFKSQVYTTDGFRVSYLTRPTICGPAVLVLEDHLDGPRCIGDSLGDSVHVDVDVDNAFQKLKKTSKSDELMFEFTETDVLDDEYLNVSLSRINNFGHWHVHNVSFLLWLSNNITEILSAVGAKGVRVLCPHGLDHMGKGMKQHAVAELAKVCPVVVLDPMQLQRPTRLNSVLVCSTANLDNGPMYPATFASLFPQLRVERDETAPALIYCNRSHAGRRGIDNEPAIEAALAKIGFAVMPTGAMTYDEQRRGFSNARLIISSHGSSLMDMIFSHNKPTVIELTHRFYGPHQYTSFRNMTALMGGRYGALISPVPEEYKGADYNGTYFRVDIDWLVSAAQSLKAELGVP